MFEYPIVVVGTSAGGLTALKNLLIPLPANFPAVVLIVKHLQPSTNLLPALLRKDCQLPVLEPTHGQPLKEAHVFIAPPGVHMTIAAGKIQLDNGPRINHFKPAIDPLFYSAALFNGPKTIGILLSGMLDDGSAGLLAIKKCGGKAIVQELAEAEYPEMPQNGLRNVKVDYCLPSAQMASLLCTLVQQLPEPKKEVIPDIDLLQVESNMNLTKHNASEEILKKIAIPSSFSCPACRGVLWKIDDDSVERYRCRVGHAYGLKSLEVGYAKHTEDALWAALGALEEKEQLAKRIADRAQEDDSENKIYFTEKAKKVEEQVKAVREILEKPQPIDD